MQNTCPHCSTALDQDVVFCPFCGKPVSSNSAAIRSTSPIAHGIKHTLSNKTGRKIEPTCPTCGDILGPNSDNCYRCIPTPEYVPLPPKPAPPVYRKATASEIIGMLISIVGVLLIIGNLTGFFPTFPFAGFIVMIIGGLIAKSGAG